MAEHLATTAPALVAGDAPAAGGACVPARRDTGFSWLGAAVLAYVAVYLVWQAAFGGASRLGPPLALLAFIPLSLTAVLALARAARNPRLEAASRRGLTWLAASFACTTAGTTIWFVQRYVTGDDPTYSWANVPYLLAYVTAACGLLAFPITPQPWRSRWTLGLDAAILTIGAAAMVWFWVVLPLATRVIDVPWWHRLVLIAYPAGGLLQFVALMPRLGDPGLGQWRRPFQLLIGGLFCYAIADLGYQIAPRPLEEPGGGFNWPDLGFGLGYALLIWSADLLRTTRDPLLAGPRDGAAGLLWNPLPMGLTVMLCLLWARASLWPWQSPQSPLGLAGVAVILLILLRETVTARENARLTRREGERQALERFREIIQSVNLGVIVAAPDTTPIVVNRAATELLGVTEDELMGRSAYHPTWHAVREDGTPFRPDDWPVSVALRTRRPVRGVVIGMERPRHGDRVWMLVDAEPELDARGAVRQVLNTFLDVSDRRAFEIQLREAQRMEAVGRLAGGVAHDFNNLLTSITGHVSLLQADLAPDDARRRDLEHIDVAAWRAAELTRQLLAFSRRQLLHPAVVDLQAVIAEKLPLIRSLAGEGIAVEVRTSPALPPVEVDRAQLEQVLLNLVMNARDAMPQGGRLRLELDALPAAGQRPAQVRLAVGDNGCGMTPDVLGRAFEPFFTTKPVGKGTGLGLASVYGLVKQSGGDIAIASREGEGTTITIQLPASDKPVARPPAAAMAAAPGRETILLVEDEESLRRVLRRGLDRLGYRVYEAASGEAALAIVDRDPQPPIDLLVTDVVMRGMTGVALAAKVRERRPHVPALFISGYADEDVVRYGLDGADAELLPKPFTAEQLGAMVRSRLLGRRPR